MVSRGFRYSSVHKMLNGRSNHFPKYILCTIDSAVIHLDTHIKLSINQNYRGFRHESTCTK